MTAAIFNLGVRGLVTIDNRDDALTVKVTGKEPDADLPVGEEVLFRYFSDKRSVTIDKSTGPGLATKRNEFMAALQRENRNVWFNHNIGFAVLGVVLMIMTLIGMVALDSSLSRSRLVVAAVGGILQPSSVRSFSTRCAPAAGSAT